MIIDSNFLKILNRYGLTLRNKISVSRLPMQFDYTLGIQHSPVKLISVITSLYVVNVIVDDHIFLPIRYLQKYDKVKLSNIPEWYGLIASFEADLHRDGILMQSKKEIESNGVLPLEILN